MTVLETKSAILTSFEADLRTFLQYQQSRTTVLLCVTNKKRQTIFPLTETQEETVKQNKEPMTYGLCAYLYHRPRES